MVSGGRSLTCLGGFNCRAVPAVRARWAVGLVRSWNSFLAGGQSGDRPQNGVKMLASAEVMGQSAPVLGADAVPHADPLRGVGPAFGLMRCGDGGKTGS